MKVSLIIYDLDIKGGTHKQVLRLCEYLAEQNIDFEIITCFFNPETTYKDFLKFPIKCIHKCKSIEYYSNFTKWNRIFKKCKEKLIMWRLIDKKSNIINLHDNGVIEIAFIDKIMGYKRKIVWQVNDLPFCFRKGVAMGIKNSFRLKLNSLRERFFAKFVDVFTVNVTKNKVAIKRIYGKNAYVFHCGIDKLVDGNLIKISYRRKNIVKLVSTGVFFSYRRYEDILYAMKILENKGIATTLKIIGSFERGVKYYSYIYKLIEDLKLKKRVEILGQIDQENLIRTYLNSDIFIFVNKNQSWGLAMFEAMSAGLPVIVSNSVGGTEILTNGVNALFIKHESPEDIATKIELLAKDKELYCKLSEKCIEFVDNYSWEKSYCSQMLNLFKELSL